MDHFYDPEFPEGVVFKGLNMKEVQDDDDDMDVVEDDEESEEDEIPEQYGTSRPAHGDMRDALRSKTLRELEAAVPIYEGELARLHAEIEHLRTQPGNNERRIQELEETGRTAYSQYLAIRDEIVDKYDREMRGTKVGFMSKRSYVQIPQRR